MIYIGSASIHADHSSPQEFPFKISIITLNFYHRINPTTHLHQDFTQVQIATFISTTMSQDS